MKPSAGRRGAVEIVSNEEIERQWRKQQAEKRAQKNRSTQGIKLFDITALVNDIKKGGVQSVTEQQKQQIREIQRQKQNQELYINPGRLAMISGETNRPGQLAQGDSYCPARDGPLCVLNAAEINTQAFLNAAIAAGREKAESAAADAARKQVVRDCEKCFKARRFKRPCNIHRNTHDNVLTTVALCPHIDMRLFWFADDPANKKDSWLLDVSDVHAQDVDAHKDCKVKSAEDGVGELVVLLEKYMERHELRAPNISRLVRQLPMVWHLMSRDEKEGVVRVTHIAPANLPLPGTDMHAGGGLVPLVGMYTSVHRKVRAGVDGQKKDDKSKVRDAEKRVRVVGTSSEKKSDIETKQPAKKVAETTSKPKEKTTQEPENIVKSSKKTATETKPDVSSPTKIQSTKQATKAKPTSKKPASEKHSPAKKSKLSEEIVYDSDEGLSGDNTSIPVSTAPLKIQPPKIQPPKIQPPKIQPPKRKVEGIQVSSSDKDVQEPVSKKRKANPRKEVIQQPKPGSKIALPSVSESSEHVRPVSGEVEEQSTSLKKRKASSDATTNASMKKRKISVAEGTVEEQPNLLKKRRISVTEETEQPTSAKKRKALSDATTDASMKKRKISITKETVEEQPTSLKKRKALSDATTNASIKKRKIAVAEVTVAETLTANSKDASLASCPADIQQPAPPDTSFTTPPTETQSPSPTPSIVVDADVEQLSKSSGRPRSS